MININKHLMDTLKPLGILVAFQSVPTGTKLPDEYVTFSEINVNPAFEASDMEIETERLVQVNVWSKSNYFNLVEEVKRLMEQAGYERTLEYDAPYSDGDSHYNKVLRFVFFDSY